MSMIYLFPYKQIIKLTTACRTWGTTLLLASKGVLLLQKAEEDHLQT